MVQNRIPSIPGKFSSNHATVYYNPGKEFFQTFPIPLFFVLFSSSSLPLSSLSDRKCEKEMEGTEGTEEKCKYIKKIFRILSKHIIIRNRREV